MKDSTNKKSEKAEKIDLKEQMISEKLDWIRLRKKITNIADLDPLTINIEQIYSLPADIQVTDEGRVERPNIEAQGYQKELHSNTDIKV